MKINKKIFSFINVTVFLIIVIETVLLINGSLLNRGIILNGEGFRIKLPILYNALSLSGKVFLLLSFNIELLCILILFNVSDGFKESLKKHKTPFTESNSIRVFGLGILFLLRNISQSILHILFVKEVMKIATLPTGFKLARFRIATPENIFIVIIITAAIEIFKHGKKIQDDVDLTV